MIFSADVVLKEAASFYLVKYGRQKERRWETIYGFSSAFYVLKEWEKWTEKFVVLSVIEM